MGGTSEFAQDAGGVPVRGGPVEFGVVDLSGNFSSEYFRDLGIYQHLRKILKREDREDGSS